MSDPGHVATSLAAASSKPVANPDPTGQWRVIITDSESESGVAPVCPHQNDYTRHSTGDGYMQEPADQAGVYDCCPDPHLECGSPYVARIIAAALTAAEVRPCD